MMAQIRITGNEDIDGETAQIALMVRAWRPGSNDAYCYNEAMRIRDAIMKGTRELDGDLLESHLDCGPGFGAALARDGSADYDDSFTGPVL